MSASRFVDQAWRQCEGKRGWRQRRTAKRAARQTETYLGGGHCVHYRCPHCGLYHVGHARRSTA